MKATIEKKDVFENYRIFAKSFWITFEGNKESASLLVKSPISTKNTRSTVTTHKRGLPIRACIQAFGDAYKSAWKVAHFL